jgi:cytoskeletal protein RodZ
MSDAPTQGFDSQPPVNNDAAKSRLPLILGIIGGVLLILVIVLLVLLLGKNTATPTAAETTSPPTDSSDSNSTPVPVRTVTVTETPPPSSGTVAPEKPNGNNVLITQYTITPSTIKCSADQTQLHITWKSVNGNVAFFGVNTVDAQAGGMGWNLPASGTDHDFGAFSAYPYMVSCNTTPNSYTLTVDGNGSKQSLTIKLKQTP